MVEQIINNKLVESLAQIIQSLTPKKAFLEEKTSVTTNLSKVYQGEFYQISTPEQWIQALQEWFESHCRDIPL